MSTGQPPTPPAVPAYATPPRPPKSVTITFPVIRGKLAAFLYLTTLLLLAAIAWAEAVNALTVSEAEERYKLNYCAGTVYGLEDYTQDEKDQFRELCGHEPRSDTGDN